MADITVKLPFGNPLNPPLIALRDMGDGTFAPVISASGISTSGGTTQIKGNNSTNGKKGSGLIIQDATTAADAPLGIVASGSSGTTGQIIQSNATYANWTTIFATAASAPSAFLTNFFYDSTAVTGGLYAWNGASYTKVSSVAS